MSILNHKEALELAHYQKEHSNLSRCYIDLTEQLAEREKQIVMLREAVVVIPHDLKDGMLRINEALAATADLSGYILCDAEPVFLFRRKGISKDFCTCDEKRFLELSGMQNHFEIKTLYKAKEKS